MKSLNPPKPDALKMVIFGAGKIGRSFIGQLFMVAGYEVVFVDIDRSLTDSLNRNGEYRIMVRSDEGDKILRIHPVRAVCLEDSEEVVRELAETDLAAFSIGQKGISEAIPIFARGLVLRRELFGDWPLDLILAENLRNADEVVRDGLSRHLPRNYPIHRLVGLVETSIGKMVPIMTRRDLEEDTLQVFAEPYNTLIVSKNGFRNPIPCMDNLVPKENIKAWVDRKLFIHNLGHATAAYLGYQRHPDYSFMFEVLEDPIVYKSTRKTMLQSAHILMAMYPGEFTLNHLRDHIDDLLHRFRNKALGDTVFRVGCDLFRKLGPEDRLVAPIQAALRLNLPCDLIIQALNAALHFRATDENGQAFRSDLVFFKEVEKGTDHILRYICKLEPAYLVTL